MTLLLTNEEVEQALTPQDAIAATESIYRELAEGKALNRARSQVYLPAESRENPGFHYRMKTQEGGSLDCGVWALRVTSDMAGFSYTAGVKRRRILPVATGNKYCGLVILFDVEKIEPVAIMPDGVIQKVRVAAMSAVGARYLAPERPKVLGLFGSGWQASAHLEFLAAQYKFDQIKVFVLVIVTSREEVGTLRQAHMVFHDNGCKIVDPDIFPQPNVVSNLEFPRKFDKDPGLDDDAASDLCAKKAEDEVPQMKRLEEVGRQERGTEEPPGPLHQARAPRRPGSLLVAAVAT